MQCTQNPPFTAEQLSDLSMNLALFDFDGTITTSDTFSPFVRYAVTPGRMLAGALLLGPLAPAYLARPRVGEEGAAYRRTRRLSGRLGRSGS